MLKNFKKNNNKGFTLVELLVVIAIMGILAVVAVPSLFKNIEKAKVAEATAYINAYKTAAVSGYANAYGNEIKDEAIEAVVEGKQPATITSINTTINDSNILLQVTVNDDNVKAKLATQFDGDSSVEIK